MYGNPTDPTPYIAAAYIIGFIAVFGYSFWAFRERKRLESYLAVLGKGRSS